MLEKERESQKEKGKEKAKDKPYYLGPSNLKADPTDKEDNGDPFTAAVTRAEIAVGRLETTQMVVQGIIGITELGAGWIPGVGKGVAVIGEMLTRAQEIGVGRVSALRLVGKAAGRC